MSLTLTLTVGSLTALEVKPEIRTRPPLTALALESASVTWMPSMVRLEPAATQVPPLPTFTVRVGFEVALAVPLLTVTAPPEPELISPLAVVYAVPATPMLPLALITDELEPKFTLSVGFANALAWPPLTSTSPPPEELSAALAVV